MKILHNIYIALFVFILSIGIFCFAVYHYCFSATGEDEILNIVEIEPGSIASIATSLKEEGYIRNKLAFKVYAKLFGKTNLKAGTYELSKSMGLIEIVNILAKGIYSDTNNIQILFKEGLNLRQIAKIIEDNTNNSVDDVYELLDDKEYLNKLIDEYWFLTDAILNEDIYYSLEGYLFPSTYYFGSANVSVKTIFESMLDETRRQLEEYKDKFNNNDSSVHEILTMASIVELEGSSLEDRKGIAGVLYNRLASNMSLGCDVTTFYGLEINIGDVHADNLDLNACNNYNTRCATFKTLPISPICNPSLEAIVATLEYTISNNYYFVADKNRKVYFSKNINEHNNTIARLKNQGLWY